MLSRGAAMRPLRQRTAAMALLHRRGMCSSIRSDNEVVCMRCARAKSTKRGVVRDLPEDLAFGVVTRVLSASCR